MMAPYPMDASRLIDYADKVALTFDTEAFGRCWCVRVTYPAAVYREENHIRLAYVSAIYGMQKMLRPVAKSITRHSR